MYFLCKKYWILAFVETKYSLQTSKIFNVLTFFASFFFIFFYLFLREENEQKLKYVHGLLEGCVLHPKIIGGIRTPATLTPPCGEAPARGTRYRLRTVKIKPVLKCCPGSPLGRRGDAESHLSLPDSCLSVNQKCSGQLPHTKLPESLPKYSKRVKLRFCNNHDATPVWIATRYWCSSKYFIFTLIIIHVYQ